MPNLEERVALLEGRVQEQSASLTDGRGTGAELRQSMRDLRQEMGDLREALRQSVRDLRTEIGEFRAEMDRRFDRIERHFGWLVGIVVTGFVAVIGTVASAFWALLQTVQ